MSLTRGGAAAVHWEKGGAPIPSLPAISSRAPPLSVATDYLTASSKMKTKKKETGKE
jgi:hypothetical protein